MTVLPTHFFYDTETALIAPGLLAPPLTCLTYCTDSSSRANLVNHTEAVDNFRWALENDLIIVGQNVAYDNAVMCVESPGLLPLVFKAYKESRVTDTMIRQQLADISSGEFRGYLDRNSGVWRKRDYSLASLAMRHFKITLEKDEWRLRYGEFRDVPIEQWPEGAREYPRKDAETTRDVFLRQEALYGPEILADQYRQSYAAFCLHLCSAWGIHTSEEGVKQLSEATEAARSLLLEELVRAGLLRANGSRDTKKAKAHMIKVMGGEDNCRKTASGGICLDEDACEASEDPLMQNYAKFSTLNKVMTTDVELLRAGIKTPVQTRYGVTETGRTTSSKPNIQNLRRMPGVREAFIPRKGYVFAQADYHAFELFALGQTCLDLFGHSALAEAVNNGLDAHTQVAATILHATYDEVAKRVKEKEHDADMARQTGKVANFGFPGGLGPTRLVDYAWKGYGVKITEPEARDLKNNWVLTWPEMSEFFEHVSSLKNEYGGYNVFLPRSKRWRGNTTFCAAANTFFQGQAADAAKCAICLVTEACYIDRSSPLFDSRLVAFVHDELILESPRAVAAEAAEELSRLMVLGAKIMLPDMNIRAEPCLMAYWSKNAKTLHDDKGRLMIWGDK